MARGVKKFPKQLSRDEELTLHVSNILNAEKITPDMIYKLILDGHNVYKQGVGLSHNVVWEAILKPFEEQGRKYINPYKIALLREQSYPNPEDYDHLKE